MDRKEYLKAWSEKNRASLKRYYKAWISKPGNLDKHRAAQKKYRLAQRDLALQAFGNKCVCCNESYKPFLSFDHIHHGRGNPVKRLKITSAQYYKWLAETKPKEYQILCHNCNQAKGYYGVCRCQIDKLNG